MKHENIWYDDYTGLYKKLTGEASVIDILTENNLVFQNPQFNKLKYVIYDFREVTRERALKPEEVSSIAKVTRMRSNTRDAIKLGVLTKNSPDFINAAESFGRLISNSNVECKVFVDDEEALAWARS